MSMSLTSLTMSSTMTACTGTALSMPNDIIIIILKLLTILFVVPLAVLPFGHSWQQDRPEHRLRNSSKANMIQKVARDAAFLRYNFNVIDNVTDIDNVDVNIRSSLRIRGPHVTVSLMRWH